MTLPAVAGQVTEFDEAGGLGTVVSARGDSYRFHCTQIADGTRTIEVGATVTFVVMPARLGTFEAFEVRRGWPTPDGIRLSSWQPSRE